HFDQHVFVIDQDGFYPGRNIPIDLHVDVGVKVDHHIAKFLIIGEEVKISFPPDIGHQLGVDGGTDGQTRFRTYIFSRHYPKSPRSAQGVIQHYRKTSRKRRDDRGKFAVIFVLLLVVKTGGRLDITRTEQVRNDIPRLPVRTRRPVVFVALQELAARINLRGKVKTLGKFPPIFTGEHKVVVGFTHGKSALRLPVDAKAYGQLGIPDFVV